MDPDDIGRALDGSLIKILEDNHGKRDALKSKRGRTIQVTPGKQITENDIVTAANDSTSVNDAAGPSGIHGSNENNCFFCDTDYISYSGPEWLQCIFCLVWVCGNCNGGMYNDNFGCPGCKFEEYGSFSCFSHIFLLLKIVSNYSLFLVFLFLVEGIYAMVMACVCMCVCDASTYKHDIPRSKSCINFKLGM